MTLSESVKNYPPCPHLHGRNCEWISSKVGRLYSVTALLCNYVCRRSGPYCGQPATDEKAFLKKVWVRMSPIGDHNLAKRVLSNYARPVDVHVPAIWPEIKSALSHIDNDGFTGIMLTGSVILRRDVKPKDLDVVLCFDNVKSALACAELPKEICGIKTDFFYYIGKEPDVYFACLDCDAKKLYLSRWLKLTINSIEQGIEVIERGTNQFGECITEMLGRSDEETAKAKEGWKNIVLSWSSLTKFVEAARSRGVMATAKHIAGLNSTDGLHCDEQTLNQRRASCATCSVRIQNGAGHQFCGACGCGETQLARLDADKPEDYCKLMHPTLHCPLRKKGFSNHVETV